MYRTISKAHNRALQQFNVSFARYVSTFSYLVPGQLPPRRHQIAWREAERSENWSTEGIPEDVSTQMVNSVKGSPEAFFELCSTKVSAKLDKYKTESAQLYLLHALRAVLEQRSVNPLKDSDWNSLLAEPTPEEMLSVSTSEGIRNIIKNIHNNIINLQSELGKRSFDAFDSGEVDFELSMDRVEREKIQINKHKDLLINGVQVLRQLSLIASSLHNQASPMHSSMMEDAVRRLKPLLSTPSNTYEMERSLKGFNIEMAQEELANFDQNEAWDETVAQMLAHKEKFEFKLPRKILPAPLHADAPDQKLSDVARVIDENTSLSKEDKEYILQHYADVIKGDAEKALGDFAAEKKAYIDPQPLWGVYDPDLVKKQDAAADATLSQGLYSAEKGKAIESVWVDPRTVGAPNLNPKNDKMMASEEVQRTLKHYDDSLAPDIDNVSKAITEALARSMGIKPPQSGSGKSGSSGSGGIHAAPGVNKEDATKAVKSFFQRYTAGERLPVPEPPKGGFRVTEAHANPDAGKKATPDKKGKGKK